MKNPPVWFKSGRVLASLLSMSVFLLMSFSVSQTSYAGPPMPLIPPADNPGGQWHIKADYHVWTNALGVLKQQGEGTLSIDAAEQTFSVKADGVPQYVGEISTKGKGVEFSLGDNNRDTIEAVLAQHLMRMAKDRGQNFEFQRVDNLSWTIETLPYNQRGANSHHLEIVIKGWVYVLLDGVQKDFDVSWVSSLPILSRAF